MSKEKITKKWKSKYLYDKEHKEVFLYNEQRDWVAIENEPKRFVEMGNPIHAMKFAKTIKDEKKAYYDRCIKRLDEYEAKVKHDTRYNSLMGNTFIKIHKAKEILKEELNKTN